MDYFMATCIVVPKWDERFEGIMTEPTERRRGLTEDDRLKIANASSMRCARNFPKSTSHRSRRAMIQLRQSKVDYREARTACLQPLAACQAYFWQSAKSFGGRDVLTIRDAAVFLGLALAIALTATWDFLLGYGLLQLVRGAF
jgi:hypothetical protein